MRINGNELHNESLSQALLQPGKSEKAQREGDASVGSLVGTLAGDSTAISQTASLVSRTALLPDLDTARVGDVRKAIAEGSIEVDPGHIATALINSMLN